jgi:cell division protein FtsZ
LGESGLGAGANPEVARRLAVESRDQLIDFIGTETKMLFITAGLGKGTGTGAAPVVAEIAKEMGILTIAVVTLPFKFEGSISAQFAEAGVNELRKHVDSLIIIKNQNIIKYYNDEELDKAFGYADDVLKNAVKCIAEMITINSEQNVDFNDIQSIMKDSGAAMLGIAEANGDNRIDEALAGVLRCPLLTEENISNARNLLFSISYGSEKKLRICELEKLTDKFEELKSKNCHVIWGRNEDPMLGDKIKLSVIISKYSSEITEASSLEPDTNIYEGDKLKHIKQIDKGSSYFSPSAPDNMIPSSEDTPYNDKNDDDEFGFLKDKEPARIIQKEMVLTPHNEIEAAFNAGPQKIRSTYDPQYEDDDQFKFLIETPRITQLRQEDKIDFQDKAIQNNQTPSFKIDDDLHEFFKNLPD